MVRIYSFQTVYLQSTFLFISVKIEKKFLLKFLPNLINNKRITICRWSIFREKPYLPKEWPKKRFPTLSTLVTLSLTQHLQHLLNELPVERSILANISYCHLNSLNGKLNWSRNNNMHGSQWTKNDQSGRQRVDPFF